MQLAGERVCVTGATGFVGGALVRALAAHGAEVHALRRDSSNTASLEGTRITWHSGDTGNPRTLEPLLRGARWVVHASGQLGGAGISPDLLDRANVASTRHVLEAALAFGDRPRVLHVSSAGVVGPSSAAASEDAPLRPTNPYERSKAEAERVALDFASRGLDVVLARPGFLYGPGDRHVLGLFRAIRRRRFFFIGGGRHRCQPTFIDDAVAGMLGCLRQGRAGEAYHLSGSRPVSFRELAGAISRAVGAPVPRLSVPRPVAMAAACGLEITARAARRSPPLGTTAVAFFSEDRLVSSEKARRELGFTPSYELASGIERTVSWYREHGWL